MQNLSWKVRLFILAGICYTKILAQTTHIDTVNVLFLNEATNKQAANAMDLLLQEASYIHFIEFRLNVTNVTVEQANPKKILKKICSSYSEMLNSWRPPHIIIDTTLTATATETSKQFILALGLPALSTSLSKSNAQRELQNLPEQQKKYLFRLEPVAYTLAKVIGRLIDQLKINNAAILYDKSILVGGKLNTTDLKLSIRHVIAPIAPTQQRAKQIEEIRKSNIFSFFILGHNKIIRDVFDSVKPEYFKRNFVWWAITEYPGVTLRPGERVAFITFKLHPPFIPHQLQYIEPETSVAFYRESFISVVLAVSKMIASSKWPTKMEYLHCDDYNGTNTPVHNVDLQYYLRNISEITDQISIDHETGTSINAKLRASITYNTSNVTFNVGEYYQRKSDPIVIERRADDVELLKATIIHRIYIVIQPPFVMPDKNASKGYKGYCIDIIDEMARSLNFDYELYEDRKHGSMNERGEWSGIIRKLIDKEADIGLGGFSIMSERELFIDFTEPFYEVVGYTVLMRMTKRPTSLYKFFDVMEPVVWLCILAVYLSTCFLIWSFEQCSPYSYYNNKHKYDSKTRIFTIKECIWFALTSVTPQGGGKPPKNMSSRVVSATWWLFGFIVLTSYTANLAAYLTIQRMEKTIESLEDLGKQYRTRYSALKGSTALSYFKHMAEIEGRFYELWKDMSFNKTASPYERSKIAVWNYPVSDKFTKYWYAMKAADPPETLVDAVRRVRASTRLNASFAFVGESTDIRYLEMTTCDLRIVGKEFAGKPYAFALQKNSPLKADLDSAIRQLLADGYFFAELERKWWNRDEYKSKCERVPQKNDGISIENAGGAFIIVLLGIIASFIALMWEVISYRSHNAVNIMPKPIKNIIPEVPTDLHENQQAVPNTVNADRPKQLSKRKRIKTSIKRAMKQCFKFNVRNLFQRISKKICLPKNGNASIKILARKP